MNAISIPYTNDRSTHIRYWWGLLLSGLLLFLAGALMFQYPFGDFLGVSQAFGLVMISFGITHMAFCSANRTVLPSWHWQTVMSISDVVMGMVLLLYSDISIRFMPVVLGAWFFIRGISMASYALNLRQLLYTGWGWVLTAGILTIFLASFVVYNPVFGFFTIIIWTSFAFMLTGLFIMLLSFKVKQGRDELESIIL